MLVLFFILLNFPPLDISIYLSLPVSLPLNLPLPSSIIVHLFSSDSFSFLCFNSKIIYDIVRYKYFVSAGVPGVAWSIFCGV